jgi:hypothetical protein
MSMLEATKPMHSKPIFFLVYKNNDDAEIYLPDEAVYLMTFNEAHEKAQSLSGDYPNMKIASIVAECDLKISLRGVE